MSPNSVLLDTSVVVRHFRDATALADKLASFEELYLPGPALAELYYGAYRSDRTQQHLDQIEKFLAAADVLSPDQATSEHYGKIAATLARNGTLIPQNDIWMAALSIQSGLPLATMDRHLSAHRGIKIPALVGGAFSTKRKTDYLHGRVRQRSSPGWISTSGMALSSHSSARQWVR